MVCGVYRALAKRNHLTSGGFHQHFTEADPKTQEVTNFLRILQLTELREKSEMPPSVFLLCPAEGPSHSLRTFGTVGNNLLEPVATKKGVQLYLVESEA